MKHDIKNEKPRVFVGSSLEALPIAKAIQFNLQHVSRTTLWKDNIFKLSHSALESLEHTLDQYDFAVFVLSPEDKIFSRKHLKPAPRDNVLFELGLFAGRLGRKNVFIVLPEGFQEMLPTDLLGITCALYDPNRLSEAIQALGPACTTIESYLAPRPDEIKYEYISWPELCESVRKLASQLRRSPHAGGFSFDVVVGISRGGIGVADLLVRNFGGLFPVICLWADRHHPYPQVRFDGNLGFVNENVIKTLQDDAFRNILLIDDVCRSGTTIRMAKEYLIKKLPNKNIQCAVLVKDRDVSEGIDYHVSKRSTRHVRTPFSRVE